MATKKKKQKATWERAYQGHVLWLGKARLGKVTLLTVQKTDARGKYRWEAAEKAGFSDGLDKAKAAVEFAVLSAEKQMDLFK